MENSYVCRLTRAFGCAHELYIKSTRIQNEKKNWRNKGEMSIDGFAVSSAQKWGPDFLLGRRQRDTRCDERTVLGKKVPAEKVATTSLASRPTCHYMNLHNLWASHCQSHNRKIMSWISDIETLIYLVGWITGWPSILIVSSLVGWCQARREGETGQKWAQRTWTYGCNTQRNISSRRTCNLEFVCFNF